MNDPNDIPGIIAARPGRLPMNAPRVIANSSALTPTPKPIG